MANTETGLTNEELMDRLGRPTASEMQTLVRDAVDSGSMYKDYKGIGDYLSKHRWTLQEFMLEQEAAMLNGAL